MNILTEKQISYIAGIIDGEGNISVNRQKQKGGKDWNYHIHVVITNTKIELLKYIQELTKIGNIYQNVDDRPNHNKSWRWYLTNNEIKPFLEVIINDLMIKKKQAKLMLEFIDLKKHKANRYYTVPLEISIERELIWEELRELNRKGIINNGVDYVVF